MASGRRRIYWDSDVWLSYINAYPERMPVLDALLNDSASTVGDIEIVTSTISQTEVAFALVEQNNSAPDISIEQKIDSLWGDTKAITLIEYHTVIAVEARSLIRMGLQYKWSLKPLDAIHLATAKWFDVTEFHTYDTRLTRYSSEVGFPILEPHVAGGPAATQPPLIP